MAESGQSVHHTFVATIFVAFAVDILQGVEFFLVQPHVILLRQDAEIPRIFALFQALGIAGGEEAVFEDFLNVVKIQHDNRIFKREVEPTLFGVRNGDDALLLNLRPRDSLD